MSEVGSARARHSHGLEQFASQFSDETSQFLLDLGGATQASISFITNLGHKLYTEDFLQLVDGAFGSPPPESAEDLSPEVAREFLRQNLGFPNASFDGLLLWDVLEFLPQPLLKAVVRRLFEIAKPGAYLLAFFHADEKASEVPLYSYQILDGATLRLVLRETRRPVHLFNNRAVEKLFEGFHSVKFFLARDNLREVIVRR